MAFNKDKLRALGLTATGYNLYFLDASADDTLATVNTAGYINNTDDNLSLVAGDEVMVKASDKNAHLVVLSVSSGSVTTVFKSLFMDDEDGATTANLRNYGLSRVGGTAALTYTMDAPVRGIIKTLLNDCGTAATINMGTGAVTVWGTAGATCTQVLFAAIGDSITLKGQSATVWEVIAQVGGVTTT